MIIVKVRNPKDIDRALKILKYKFNKIGIGKEYRERQEFIKPSVKRRNEKLNAIYREKKNLNQEDNFKI